VPRTVHRIATAVAKLGYDTHALGLRDDLDDLERHVRRVRPDLVVNLLERYSGTPQLAPDVAAALDLLRTPYTGAGPAGLYPARILHEMRGTEERIATGCWRSPGECGLAARIAAGAPAGLCPHD
jgi:hypothetical protein